MMRSQRASCRVASAAVSDDPIEADPDEADPGVRLTPAGSVVDAIRNRVGRVPTEDEHAAVDELIPEGDAFGEYLARFSMLIALSAAIAAFGLLSDSAAVVIGAMLVAPLMTPITAAAAAMVTARNTKLWRALAVVALGTALAIAVGWLTSLIAGGAVVDVRDLPDEVRARTFPTLLDLGVAISAGAAAGYILPRRSAVGALPGVGIAVALVPPLATVGIAAELGLPTEARNAFLLFVTNLAAIVFAAGVALLLTGFRPGQFEGARALRTRLVITILAVAIVAIPLYRHSQSVLEDQQLRSTVTRAVEEWDETVRIVDLVADKRDGSAAVELLVVGQGDPRPAWQLADEIRARFGSPVDLRLLYQRDELFLVSSR
jgi:uncharacterized hydrophobic protein (TIGR00271 family)